MRQIPSVTLTLECDDEWTRTRYVPPSRASVVTGGPEVSMPAAIQIQMGGYVTVWASPDVARKLMDMIGAALKLVELP